MEVEGGIGTAGGGLLTGPGVVIVSTSGLATALHGSGVGVVATSDLAKTMKELYKLNTSADNPVDGPNQEPNGGTQTNSTTLWKRRRQRKN